MANITKKVGRHIPPTQRSQKFDQTEVSEGDIIKIQDSLGHPASHMQVDATGEFGFRLNVVQTLFPRYGHDHPGGDVFLHGSFGYVDELPFLASGQEYIDPTGAEYQLTNESMVFDNDLPISDLIVTVASGVYEVLVT